MCLFEAEHVYFILDLWDEVWGIGRSFWRGDRIPMMKAVGEGDENEQGNEALDLLVWTC